ncbi:hypothetical protein CesoFtcFv8_005710 [Champsocephalus esox]|uniref:Uncharacterized protein n=1 Tax=Champsocephalus esox TaxID=159716 RepID=A0AAN8CL32_9TELE|nr:hypothetical protein CesoFtcFv8_005710 [Champsocephalus esox]
MRLAELHPRGAGERPELTPLRGRGQVTWRGGGVQRGREAGGAFKSLLLSRKDMVNSDATKRREATSPSEEVQRWRCDTSGEKKPGFGSSPTLTVCFSV